MIRIPLSAYVTTEPAESPVPQETGRDENGYWLGCGGHLWKTDRGPDSACARCGLYYAMSGGDRCPNAPDCMAVKNGVQCMHELGHADEEHWAQLAWVGAAQSGSSGTDEDCPLHIAAEALQLAWDGVESREQYAEDRNFGAVCDQIWRGALAWERARTADEGWSIAGPCADAMVISANSGSFRIACGNCGVDNIASQQDDELTVHELAAIIRAHQEVDDA